MPEPLEKSVHHSTKHGLAAGDAQRPQRADWTIQIPDFRHLSDILMVRTGWQVVAVPGLVPDEVFFEHLANRRFPAGQFIRQAHELDYIEEPDVFHDVFGHVPLLLNPAIADYIQAYGAGGLGGQLPRGPLKANWGFGSRKLHLQ